MTDRINMNKTSKLFPVLALFLVCNAFADDAAFQSPKYRAKSNDPLSPVERSVKYTYPAHPCGTLMTAHSSRGSVRLGRGPVYQLMLDKCQKEDSNSYPDDNSVRTYACQNVAAEWQILGKATFAFQCGKGQGDSQSVRVPLNRIPKNLH